MIMIGAALVFGFMLCGLAFRANARFRDQDRLPMQWWLTGEVTWSAPRWLALGFVPALAICVLTAFSILAMSMKPRAGQEYIMLPTFLGLGGMFVAIELLHLWLIEKTLRRNGS